jgi:hypothetical protein
MRAILRVLIPGPVFLVAWNGPSAADGLLDTLGIQLGMPVREAHVKLQAELPKNKIQIESINLPTIDKPVIASFLSAPQRRS